MKAVDASIAKALADYKTHDQTGRDELVTRRGDLQTFTSVRDGELLAASRAGDTAPRPRGPRGQAAAGHQAADAALA
jgi:hypothetical protein